ncbi:LacI family DNA-binding transcriptional regulator [Candidatus Poriferisocius sp.]|uniref:LacI family DNA-binding transcriptional regulator n=1 Tax=Candidatus Poriferisocius sp. TaxID=3101276 RepID=UPI003B020350
MERRLNLEEIGRRAGVSRSTVSRVVNGDRNVSSKTKKRVEAVIAETGYRPHAAARSLASNSTDVLGLVIPSAVETLFDDPYFGRLIYGISRTTNEVRMTLTLFLFGEVPDESSIISRVVSPGLVDGVIVTATKMGDPLIDYLRGTNMPFVVIGRPDDGGPVYSVDVDNRGGARAAALHLAGLGHRRMALISAPSSTSAGVDRRKGFLDGITEAGLNLENRVRAGDWTESSGRRAMEDLLPDRPDAVFIASDRMAVGALGAIRDAGLSCPKDIAMVSFDGLVAPDQTVPSLTSVAQPVSKVGERAVRLLKSVIDGSVTVPECISFPTELVIRESCGSRLANGM